MYFDSDDDSQETELLVLNNKHKYDCIDRDQVNPRRNRRYSSMDTFKRCFCG